VLLHINHDKASLGVSPSRYHFLNFMSRPTKHPLNSTNEMNRDEALPHHQHQFLLKTKSRSCRNSHTFIARSLSAFSELIHATYYLQYKPAHERNVRLILSDLGRGSVLSFSILDPDSGILPRSVLLVGGRYEGIGTIRYDTVNEAKRDLSGVHVVCR
jgi:hypothetical protein